MQNSSDTVAMSTKPQPKLRMTQSSTDDMTEPRLSVPRMPHRTKAMDTAVAPKKTTGSIPLSSRCMPLLTPRGRQAMCSIITLCALYARRFLIDSS